MLEVAIMGAALWMATGHMVCLCAIDFLGAEPSLTKCIVAYIAGPFAINKEWWLKAVPKEESE